MRRVGVATDFHEASNLELARAAQLAAVFASEELVALCAYEVPVGYHTIMTWEQASSGIERSLREHADAALAAIVPHAPPLRLCLHEGPPTSRIPAMARDEHLDLLVLGTHARTRPASALMGRTSEKIIHAAGCSVWAGRDPTRYQRVLDALRELAQ